MANEKGTEVVVNNPQTPAVLQGKPADIVINQFADLVKRDNYSSQTITTMSMLSNMLP